MEHSHARSPEKRCTVRPARAGDVAQVIALDAEMTGLSKPEYWHDLFLRYDSGQAEADDHPHAAAMRRDRFFLVAAEGGTVIGFIIGEVRAWEFGSPPCGWIFTAGVRSDRRQAGIGATLFEAIGDLFRGTGVSKVRTMLARDDTLVMSFFRSQGMMAGPFIQLEKDL